MFAVLPTGFGKSVIYQVLPALFSELHRLLCGTIENFVVAVVSPLEYIRAQQVETLGLGLRKLGIQAVHRTD
jgi:superfamily II DNA helicase RecQ